MKKKLTNILRYLFWFALSLLLTWVLGIGLLFENVGPVRALVAFSLILTVLFESINIAYFSNQEEIKKLREEIEELKKK